MQLWSNNRLNARPSSSRGMLFEKVPVSGSYDVVFSPLSLRQTRVHVRRQGRYPIGRNGCFYEVVSLLHRASTDVSDVIQAVG